MRIGIDAGGTLTKVVTQNDDGSFHYESRPSKEIDTLIEELNELDNVTLYLTGGGSVYISENVKHETHLQIEFDAAYTGLTYLMKKQNIDLDRFVYLNIGTGTSFHVVENNTQRRVGGTGIGGGTLMGLSQLLTGYETFEKIVETARKGNRDTLDLKVKHIFKDGPVPKPLTPDLTASNFARVEPHHHKTASDADKLASVIGMVAEGAISFGVTLAQGFKTNDLVLIGSTLKDNDVMQSVIHSYGSLKGIQPHIIENGEYSGALGAILVTEQ